MIYGLAPTREGSVGHERSTFRGTRGPEVRGAVRLLHREVNTASFINLATSINAKTSYVIKQVTLKLANAKAISN